MALIGINSVQNAPQERRSKLQDIALGVDMAAKILGVGIEGYKAYKGKEESPLDQAIKVIALQNQKQSLEYNNTVKPLEAKKTAIELKNLEQKVPPFYESAVVDNLKKANELETSAKYLEEQLNIFNDTKRSEDERIQAGRSAYKKLNDPVMSDAVSADEAKRVGALLEYKIGNVTEPGSFIGRDLDLFSKQMQNSVNVIKNTAKFKRQSADAVLNAYHIDLPNVKAVPSDQKQANDQPKIRVSNPQTGEQFYIDPAHLPDAQKEGFQQIK